MKSLYKQFFSKLGLLVSIAGLLGITGCCIDNMCDPEYSDEDNQVSRDYLERVVIVNQQALDLSAVNGDVNIIGLSDTNIVTIEAKLIASAETQELARYYLDNLDVEVHKEESVIRVVSKHPSPNHQNVGTAIHYTIYIPEEWSIAIDHTNGQIDISGIRNKLDIRLTNGTFKMHEITGSAVVTLVNGNIVGDIDLVSDGTCLLKTLNGSIDLEIPKTTSADFNARVTNGTISVSGLELSNLETDTHYTRGQLGDGDGEILLELLNGQIVVQGY